MVRTVVHDFICVSGHFLWLSTFHVDVAVLIAITTLSL